MNLCGTEEKKKKEEYKEWEENAIASKIKLHILYSYFSYKLLFSKENLDYSFVSAKHEMQDFAYIWVLTPHLHSSGNFSVAMDITSEISHVAIFKD